MSDEIPEVNPALPNVQTEAHPTAHEFVESSEETAKIASTVHYAHAVREVRLHGMLEELPENDITDELQEQMRRTYKAGANMATVGYNNFRKLIAAGNTLPAIAKSIDVDVLDLAYYLAAFDEKGDHMEFDHTLCADSQSERLVQKMEAMDNPSREDVALIQVKLQLIETRNKRMSSKWAGVDIKAHLMEGAASRIVIQMGEAPSLDAYKNNPRVINSTAKRVDEDEALPLDENGRLVF